MSSSVLRRMVGWPCLLLAIFCLAGCAPAVSTAQPIPTVTINPNFQSALSPLPTIPPYRCGAWASTNVPGRYSTILIYARLTHDIQGVSGMQASATVHFQSSDFSAGLISTSDAGGYVSFTINLQGRQPARVPATVDVTFTGLPTGSLTCTPAFFTPN